MLIYKKILLVLAIFVYITVAIIIKIIFLFSNPYFRLKIISGWTQKFGRLLAKIVKLKIVIEGDKALLKKKGCLIISNHLGYLDGVILGSLFPVIYTSKLQVKSWPLFGWMTDVAGTIFIDRENKSKVTEYIRQTTQVLKAGINVVLFPEGTSTNGQGLRPFQSIHFQSALDARCKIIPVAITYTRIGKSNVNSENRDKIFWYGQVKFYQHLLQVLELDSIEAKVTINPAIELATASERNYSRKDLSKLLYGTIVQSYPLIEKKKSPCRKEIESA